MRNIYKTLGSALCVFMSDCFRVSVNLSLSINLPQSLFVILYHSVSVSICHAFCLSHSVSVCLSYSVHLFQHMSVRLFQSLCSCQFVPSALSLSVCPKCPVPPVCPILRFPLLGLLLLGILWLVFRLPFAFHEKNCHMAIADFGNNGKIRSDP